MALHYRTPPSYWLGEEVDSDMARYVIDQRALELALPQSRGDQYVRTSSGRMIRRLF